MMSKLTGAERRSALMICFAVLIAGGAMAALGRGDLMGAQGWVVIAFAALMLWFVMPSIGDPEPVEDRAASYYDDPTKVGIILAMIWAVIGMGMGVWVAAMLAWPDLRFDAAWSGFGRLRPVHTSGVIFGFGGNALIATSFHVMQRTSRARMPGQLSPWFVLMGYNLFCIVAASGYVMGVTQSKEYAEPEWYADIWLVVVWVTYFVLYLRTLSRRNEPHIYVANWYYLAFILVVAMLHIINNLAVPAAWTGAKSYSAFSGVQDAMTQWWYGHNAVGFFLTAGFLGMMYYFVPKQAERPIYSYRLSIVHFWALISVYIWAGPHHLHYTALPDWAQSLGMAMSIILLAPSWGGMINGMMTLSGAWHKLRTDPILRFLVVSLAFYGMSTFEGPMMAIKTVNALSHYTDWTIGHVHAGALGWVAMISIGSLYHLIPKVFARQQMHSVGLINAHFWLATIGTVLYIASMWVNGITQGLMWRAINEDGTLTYSFVEALEASHPGYLVRMIGGAFFLTGMLLMAYNTWRTVRSAKPAEYEAAAQIA